MVRAHDFWPTPDGLDGGHEPARDDEVVEAPADVLLAGTGLVSPESEEPLPLGEELPEDVNEPRFEEHVEIVALSVKETRGLVLL